MRITTVMHLYHPGKQASRTNPGYAPPLERPPHRWPFLVPMQGEPGPDLNEEAIHHAAMELLIAAGRPEGYAISSEYEREAWRHAARRVIRTYHHHDA